MTWAHHQYWCGMVTPSPPSGFLVLNKPPGPSSARALAVARRGLGVKKAGHTGTLDPFAEGVLVMAVGGATRLTELVMALPKTYEARFQLGLSTDSLDITGKVLAQQAPRPLTPDEVQSATLLLASQTTQIPPMVSALKQGGERLYDLARRGLEVPRAPRPIQVSQVTLLDQTPDTLSLSLTVSRGTYIRSFAELLGLHWGQPVVLAALRRTAVGPFDLSMALLPEDVTPATPLQPLDRAAPGQPMVTLSAEGWRKARLGQKLSPDQFSGSDAPAPGVRVVVLFEDEVVGLGVVLPSGLHVDRVLG